MAEQTSTPGESDCNMESVRGLLLFLKLSADHISLCTALKALKGCA